MTTKKKPTKKPTREIIQGVDTTDMSADEYREFLAWRRLRAHLAGPLVWTR